MFVVTALVYLLGGLAPLERFLLDWRFRLVRQGQVRGVVIVDLDGQSLRQLDVWPVSRGDHASVLEKLIAAGASRVAFDLDLSSRSGSAEQDAKFADALRAAHGRVVLAAFQQWEFAPSQRGVLTTSLPQPAFREHAELGTVGLQPERDGLVRRYHMRGASAADPLPSFAAALAGSPAGAPETFHIDYGIPAESIPRVSYGDVLAGRFSPDAFRDKAVIVGATAVELGEGVAVPLQRAIPGCLVQALAYESLTRDRALRRAGAPLTLAVALAIALLAGHGLLTWSGRAGLLLAAALCAGLFALSVVAQRLAPLLLDPAPWLFAVLGIYGYGLVHRIDRQALGLNVQRRRAQDTETLMRHVVENSFDAIVTVREDGTVCSVNRAAQEMFGWAADEAAGRRLRELVEDGEHGASGAGGEPAPIDARLPREALGRRRNGTSFAVEMILTSILKDADGQPLRVVCLRDVTERKIQRELLERQATHDALTGLPNRYLLRSRMDTLLVAARAQGSEFAFLLLDLDRFKEINDTLGHPTGDVLLRRLALRLQAPLRPGDTIARLGGDEFAILLPETGRDEAERMAREIANALDEPFAVEDLSLQVETAIGVALFPTHGTLASELFQRADVAMYTAKRGRTGVAVYDPERDFTSVRKLTVTAKLRQAIRDGELALHYQPKVSAVDGRICGVEALARWNHAELGPIAPGEFIGLAEHSGLIRSLTHWVLRAAVERLAEFGRQGLQLGVSVNISASDLRDDGVHDLLKELLCASGAPPERLTLEITESAIMEDPERALETVEKLCALGVRISIDDFGTGYSSLGYLRRLPAHEVKIDRSFVVEMARDPEDVAIVRSIIDLAHNLRLKVVAEGVETEVVWIALKVLGCDVGQGYLFGRPVPSEELAQRMQGAALSEPRERALSAGVAG
jgi:diguanylate cyclase (GGDEF)-like protein/PAS domain S-box-containing protein